MIRRKACAAILLLSTVHTAYGEDREYTDASGVMWREVTQERQKVIPETKLEERKQTVLVEQVNTEQQTSFQTYQVPITEYYWEPYWANRWNPFSQPYLAYRYVPRTRYETRTAEIKMPVTQRKLVPQERTVQVPVTTMRTVTEQYTSKIALGIKPPTLSQGGTQVATRPTLASPPQQGDAGWQPGANKSVLK